MTKMELSKGLKLIQDTYRKSINPDEIEIWWDIFKDDGYDEFKKNIISHIKNNPYMPVIANIKNPEVRTLQGF